MAGKSQKSNRDEPAVENLTSVASLLLPIKIFHIKKTNQRHTMYTDSTNQPSTTLLRKLGVRAIINDTNLRENTPI